MKKKYTVPAMDIVNIEPQDIIAASPSPISFTTEGGTAVLNDESATGDALSKGSHDIWDE